MSAFFFVAFIVDNSYKIYIAAKSVPKKKKQKSSTISNRVDILCESCNAVQLPLQMCTYLAMALNAIVAQWSCYSAALDAFHHVNSQNFFFSSSFQHTSSTHRHRQKNRGIYRNYAQIHINYVSNAVLQLCSVLYFTSRRLDKEILDGKIRRKEQKKNQQ